VADDAVSFLIDLKERFSAVAPKAASAIEGVADSLRETQGELAKFESNNSLAKTSEQTAKLGDSMAVVGADVGDVGGALKELPGPIGKAAREGSKLGDALSKLGAAGPYVAVAAAIALITVAAIAATAAILGWAVGLSDANRNATLATAGVAASSTALAGLAGILPGIQAATGLATGELNKLAEGLSAAGVSAKDMPAALRAIATATAGGATAEFIQKLNADIKSGTKSVQKLAAEVQQKFGGIVAKKLLSLDSQSAKLKSNLAGVFGGLNIEGLLSGFSTLVALFDKNTASGKALKFLFESLFQPIVDGVAKAIPVVRSLFVSALILALKAYVALKPYSSEIKVLGAAFAIVAGLIVGFVVAAVLLFVSVIAASIAICAALVAGVIFLGEAIISGLTAAWDFVSSGAQAAWAALQGAVQGAIDYVSGLSLADIGTNLITSLADGILGGAGAVVSAITGAVSNAIGAAKSLLGIHSPSKVFADLGKHTSGGFAQGVDDGSGKVDSAVASMVAAPSVPAAAGGGSFVFAPQISVEASGGSAGDTADEIERRVRILFDQFVMQFRGAAT
jgi:hypothetical protein